jgi:hypothetical protein
VRLDNHIDMKHCLHPVHNNNNNNNNNNNDIWFIYHNMTLYESLYIDFSHRQLSCYPALFRQPRHKLLYVLNARMGSSG